MFRIFRKTIKHEDRVIRVVRVITPHAQVEAVALPTGERMLYGDVLYFLRSMTNGNNQTDPHRGRYLPE